jgi:protein-S-isoprenylcysteine O-methyltransferase Ste14
MHAVVVFVEEPRLERRFGQSYLEYKGRVHRWVP